MVHIKKKILKEKLKCSIRDEGSDGSNNEGVLDCR